MDTIRITITTFIITISALILSAENTSRKQLKVKAETTEVQDTIIAQQDTITTTTGLVTISGFDKPLRSLWETFFVVNNTAKHIIGINVTFSYYDLNGHQLHNASHNVTCDIPAGETRQLRVAAWDRQHAFYYHLNKPARSAGAATPFTVNCSVTAIIIDHQE
jgi:hypothetical protein